MRVRKFLTSSSFCLFVQNQSHRPNRPQTPLSSLSSRFNGGMNCVHEYLNTCANNSVRELIERDILGAKRFYQHLCGSKKFQDNYLYHASCLRTTRPDWNDCIRQYRSIIHHEINAPQSEQDPKAAATKYLHYCW